MARAAIAGKRENVWRREFMAARYPAQRKGPTKSASFRHKVYLYG
jgi:hypothetical protein